MIVRSRALVDYIHDRIDVSKAGISQQLRKQGATVGSRLNDIGGLENLYDIDLLIASYKEKKSKTYLVGNKISRHTSEMWDTYVEILEEYKNVIF